MNKYVLLVLKLINSILAGLSGIMSKRLFIFLTFSFLFGLHNINSFGCIFFILSLYEFVRYFVTTYHTMMECEN